MSVIARSVSDEAISAENKDCFAPLAMTLWLNLMALHRGHVKVLLNLKGRKELWGG
jgi:hypothetical protein